MDIDKSKPVLVTGANGYVASWLVKYLLEDGVNVHGTVRDPENMSKVGHLKKMDEDAPGELTLFKADLFNDGAFDEAMQGCELVFHTASPFIVKGITDAEEQLVKPALQGTRNVLEAANRVECVKRIVLTSSVVSVYGDAIDMEHAGVQQFDESHWNTSSTANHQPYNYSKVVAEKAAWEIAEKQNRWDLLTINPGFVLGPSLTSQSDSTSLSTMLELSDGTYKMGVPYLDFGIVDVRDVAIGHIKAGYTPSASGRHIVNSESLTLLEMGRIMRDKFGSNYPFPTRQLPKFMVWLFGPLQGVHREFVSKNVGYPLRFDNSYACKDLNMTFRPASESVIDHFQQMIDDGLVPDKR